MSDTQLHRRMAYQTEVWTDICIDNWTSAWIQKLVLPLGMQQPASWGTKHISVDVCRSQTHTLNHSLPQVMALAANTSALHAS